VVRSWPVKAIVVLWKPTLDHTVYFIPQAHRLILSPTNAHNGDQVVLAPLPPTGPVNTERALISVIMTLPAIEHIEEMHSTTVLSISILYFEMHQSILQVSKEKKLVSKYKDSNREQ